jgi:DNA-binding response OmpR family regulator
MHKILIIEDDQIVANIYRNKLSVEGYNVEIARDGLAGLEMFQRFRPDAALLDLMLPKMTGVEILKKLRADPQFERLPIIVFSNTYLTNMVQDAWKAGATKCLSKANCSPKQVMEVLRGVLSGNGKSASGPSAPANLAGAPAPTSSAAAQPTSTRSHTITPDADEEFQADLRRTFLEGLPVTLTVLRTLLQGLIKAENEATQLKQVHEMYRRIHALAGNAGVAGVAKIARMSDALEALLKELHDKPKSITPSTLRTVASAVDCLGVLFEQGPAAEGKDNAMPSVLVVDDEAISRRAITYALEKAKLKSVGIEDPELAYDLLAQNKFNLVFLDVDMPGMSGFELCTKLRALPAHKNTPVVFVTSLNSFESRANSTISGGNDFIGKPFLFIELAVKALVYILRRRHQSGR